MPEDLDYQAAATIRSSGKGIGRESEKAENDRPLKPPLPTRRCRFLMCASGLFPFYCTLMSSLSWLRKRPHAFDVAVGAAV